VPFEEVVQPEKKQPDRKLGDEWIDWDGTVQHSDTQTSAWVFLVLAAMVILVYEGAGWGVVWLIAPRMQALGWEALLRGIAWIWSGYLAVWFLAVLLGMLGLNIMKPVVRLLGGIRWMVGPAVFMGRVFGLTRDRVAHAFVLVYNRLEVLPSLIKDPARLLLLAPRCLAKESMQGLRELKQKYGFSQVVALGGTEARKAILELRPQGIVALACERDLLVGIKDLHGRIPVLAFSNKRPEGPCKNTMIDLAAVENAVRMFLGNSVDKEVHKN